MTVQETVLRIQNTLTKATMENQPREAIEAELKTHLDAYSQHRVNATKEKAAGIVDPIRCACGNEIGARIAAKLRDQV